MKGLLRNIALHTFSLFSVSVLYSGVRVQGGFSTLVTGGIILTVLTVVVKPLLTIISFPLNFLTLGLFSIVTNMVILYILTVLVPGIRIMPFLFKGFVVSGFVIPRTFLNGFFAFLVVSVTISVIEGSIAWLNER